MKDSFYILIIAIIMVLSIFYVSKTNAVLKEEKVAQTIEQFDLESFRDSVRIERYKERFSNLIIRKRLAFSKEDILAEKLMAQTDSIISVSYYVCKKHNIDYVWFMSMIYQESFFTPSAISHKNAVGLGQITYPALEVYNIYYGTEYKLSDLYNIKLNLEISAWYLKQKLLESNDCFNEAFSKYYAGGNWKHHPIYAQNISIKRDSILTYFD